MTNERTPRQEANKARRIARHIKRAPWDACARDAFKRLPAAATERHALPPVSVSPSADRAKRGVTLTAMKRAA